MRHARVFALTGLAFAAATVAAWANQAAEPAPAADTTVVAVPDNAPVETAPLDVDLSKTHWGDAEAGAAAAATCAACHGVDGNPIDPMYPRLVGLHAAALGLQLLQLGLAGRQRRVGLRQGAGGTPQLLVGLAQALGRVAALALQLAALARDLLQLHARLAQLLLGGLLRLRRGHGGHSQAQQQRQQPGRAGRPRAQVRAIRKQAPWQVRLAAQAHGRCSQ